MKHRLLLICLSIIITLIGLEISARILLLRRWDDNKLYELTHHTIKRGRFSSYPYLPYILRANYKTRDESGNLFSHNSYGFRGKSFQYKKETGKKRIVALGASTTYGILVSDQDTYPAQLEKVFRENGYTEVEVINGGVPGWTSKETFLNFYLRVLDLDPDMIIIYQGRNDIFPIAFNNFLPDYSHYREPDYSFQYTNYLHKYLFKISRVFFIFSYLGKVRLGYSRLDENPSHGTIRFENKPNNKSQVIKNLSDAQRISVFRNNIESIIQLAKEREIEVVLSTLAFLPSRYGSGVLRAKGDKEILLAIEKRMRNINSTINELGLKYQITLVDTATEFSGKLEDLLVDGCHFNKKGQIARAKLIFRHIKPFFKK